MKVPSFVRGNIAPVFSVFNDDLKLDEKGQRNMFDFLYQTKAISAYFVRSGLGQMYSYNFDDVLQMASIACDHLKGRAPVIVGCNGIWDHNLAKLPEPALFMKQAIELSCFAEKVGAAGIVHTIPDMLKPKVAQSIGEVIIDYFETIAREVTLPIFIYQPPIINPEYRVTPAIFAELAAMPKIVAAKVSTNDAEYILSLIRATRAKEFAYIAGSETSYYAALYAGARAVVGQGCSVNPQILKVMLDRFENGNQKGTLEAQVSVNILCEKCRNPVDFLKQYAKEKGFVMGRAYRQAKDNLYIKYPEPLSTREYKEYKNLFERELKKYAHD